MMRFFHWCGLAVLSVLLGCAENPVREPVQWLKIYVSEPGVYRLARSELQAVGFNPEAAQITRLQITQRGVTVPVEVMQNGTEYTLFFYAEPQVSAYSNHDVYWLSLADAPAPRVATRAVEQPHGAVFADTFTTTLTLEENRLYSANGYEERHWFWQSFTAPATVNIAARLSAARAGQAQIQVVLAGATEGAHRVQVLVNDQAAGETQWEGRSLHRYTTTTTALRSGDNLITLRAAGAPNQPEVNFLDTVTVTYPREFIVEGDALAFRGGAQNLRVRGFRAEQPIIYDVSNVRNPHRLSGGSVSRENGATSVLFYDASAERRYIAFAPSAAKAPAMLRPARASGLRDTNQRADYLMITAAGFADALQTLVKHRTDGRLAVKMVDVEDVFNAFGDGTPAPHAIRDFIRYARERWAKPTPRFVLLVGKASYDYHDYLKGANKNLLPTYLTPSLHLGEAASDNWFVAGGEEDIHPVVAIGRIPAETPEQLRTAIDKIIAYERAAGAGEWQRRALFIADDKDPAFAASSDMLARLMPGGMTAEKVYLKSYNGDVDAARTQMMRFWNDGAGLVTYVGHGSIDTWAAGPLFGAEHVRDIKNGSRLPILLTPTCLDGFFYHPQKDSLAEDLLFKADGGMVAGVTPTGLSLPVAQDELMRALFVELFEKATPTLGEAVMNAKRQVSPKYAEMREVIETFVLLGDPALGNPYRRQ